MPEAGAWLTAAIMLTYREHVWQRDRYEALFESAPPGALRGESTPLYLVGARPVGQGQAKTAAAGNRDAAGDRGPALAIFPACTLVSSATLREHVTDH